MTSKLLLLALGFYILFCFYTTEELSSHEIIEKITNSHTTEGLLSHEVPTAGNFELFKKEYFQQETKDIDLDKISDLSMQLKRNLVRASSIYTQTFPMLVSLQIKDQDSFSKVPLDLVCVIDHSGSMDSEGKMDLAKNVFSYLVQYLDEADRLSIIIFDHTTSIIAPLTHMTEQNKRKILNAVDGIYANGGTDIHLGMAQAFEILNRRENSKSVTSIFLLSDGLDPGAQQRVESGLLSSGLGTDITINTFGFGNDHDPQLMTDIADLRDGNFYFINKPSRIDEAFMDCLSGLMTSVAQEVKIKIKPEQSKIFSRVEIIKAYGGSSIWTYNKSDDTYSTSITALVSGKQKDYVLELQLPYTEGSVSNSERKIKVASTKAIMTGFDGRQIVKEAELYVTVLNEFEEFETAGEEDNKDVMMNLYRVKSAELMEEARKLADNNKFKEAKKMLESFKEEVENSFLKEEQFIGNLIVDLKKAIRDVDPRVYADSGRQYMFNNARSNMQQKSSVLLTNTYMNKFQYMTNTHLARDIFAEADTLANPDSQYLTNSELNNDIYDNENTLTNTDRTKFQLLTNTHLAKEIFAGADIS